MDDMEFVLTKLNNIKSENTIVSLRYDLKNEKESSQHLGNRAKQIIEDLVKNNSVLKKENEDLELENNSLKQICNNQESIIGKIPKFLLNIFLRKDKTLLSEGKNI